MTTEIRTDTPISANGNLEAEGFGKKAREWDALFRREGGQYVRALIAGRVTLGCALLGVAAFMEPRSNEVRGLPEPEERIPTQLWRMHDRGIHVAPIEKLKLARQEKKNKAGILSKPPYIGSQPSHVASKLCGHSFAGPSHPVKGSLS